MEGVEWDRDGYGRGMVGVVYGMVEKDFVGAGYGIVW